MRIILCFLPLIWIILTDAKVTPRRKCVPKTHPKNQPPKVFTTELKLYKWPPYKVSIAPGPKGQGLQQVTTFRMYTPENRIDIYRPTPAEWKDKRNGPKALLTQWRKACYKGLGNAETIFGGGKEKKVGFRIDYQKKTVESYNIQIQKNGEWEKKSTVASVLIQKNIADGPEGGKLIAEGLDKSLNYNKKVVIERHFEIVPQGDEKKASEDDIQLVIGPGKGIILTEYALANRKEKPARKNEFRRPFNYRTPKTSTTSERPKTLKPLKGTNKNYGPWG